MATTLGPGQDWQTADYSWLNPDGEGFGDFGSPLYLYRTGTMDFSWLPAELHPKVPGGGGGTPWVYVPTVGGGAGPIGNIAGAVPVWVESFDNGTGMFSRVWGPGIDTSVPGQLTIHSTPNNDDSGAMVPPWGPADSGYGYGLYSFTLSMGQGDAPGPYALTWPGTDKWPGPELDLVELLPGGQVYSTIHWKGENGTADGTNEFTSYGMDGVNPREVHTYSMLWEHGRLSGFVDGRQMWTTTEHVPLDYAHGGQNTAPGIGMQTWWSADKQHGSGYANTITLYEASYSVIA